jgi:3-methylfumaryl-CoA hydratase
VLLFRFSALTFNAHRIHYDRPYAAAEGYADLVIHGPLQVLAMAECLRRAGVSLAGRRFEYRLQAPAVGPQRLTAQRAAGNRGEEGAAGDHEGERSVGDPGAETVVLAGSVSGPVARAWVGEP